MDENCVSRINGHPVKDAVARQQAAAANEQIAATNERFAEQIAATNEQIAATNEQIDDLDDKRRETHITAQRHITYDFADNASCQGMCIDENNKMYIYGEITYPYGNLYVFNLDTMQYERTIENLKLYHGNDITYRSGKLYVSACYGEQNYTESKTICIYDLETGFLQEVNPFAGEDASGLFALSSYDENHILCALKDGTQTLEGVRFYLWNVNDFTYTEIEVTGLDKINTNFFEVLQSCEYINGYIYLMVSCTNALVSFKVSGTTATLDRIYNLPYIDDLGVTTGEYEGISKIPSGKYGSGTLCVSAIISQTYGSKKETAKSYLVNPETDLPLFPVKRWLPESNTESFRTPVYVNSESESLYEDGTSEYPFKNLARAMACMNRGKTFHGAYINIVGGTNYEFGYRNREIINIVATCNNNVRIKNINCNNGKVQILHEVAGCYVELEGSQNYNECIVILSHCQIMGQINLSLSDCKLLECVSTSTGRTAYLKNLSTLRFDVSEYAHTGEWYRAESISTIFAPSTDVTHIVASGSCHVITP